eukprot:4776626-Pleurochrysis_carterae.AAC.3
MKVEVTGRQMVSETGGRWAAQRANAAGYRAGQSWRECRRRKEVKERRKSLEGERDEVGLRGKSWQNSQQKIGSGAGGEGDEGEKKARTEAERRRRQQLREGHVRTGRQERGRTS